MPTKHCSKGSSRTIFAVERYSTNNSVDNTRYTVELSPLREQAPVH
jgi:hypothetical protein